EEARLRAPRRAGRRVPRPFGPVGAVAPPRPCGPAAKHARQRNPARGCAVRLRSGALRFGPGGLPPTGRGGCRSWAPYFSATHRKLVTFAVPQCVHGVLFDDMTTVDFILSPVELFALL